MLNDGVNACTGCNFYNAQFLRTRHYITIIGWQKYLLLGLISLDLKAFLNLKKKKHVQDAPTTLRQKIEEKSASYTQAYPVSLLWRYEIREFIWNPSHSTK